MEVLFSVIPGHGHFFPLLPLAEALKGVGHDVRFSTSTAYAETVRDHGFDSVAVGLDYTQASLAMSTDPVDRDRVVADRMFLEGPPHVIDGLLEEFSDRRPEVILVDPYDLGGQVAAELLEVPFGAPYIGIRTRASFQGLWPFDHQERLELQAEKGLRARLLELRHRYGLNEPDLVAGEMTYDRRLTLCMAPPSLEAWPLEWVSHTAHPLRPEAYVADSDDGWLDELPRDRPIVAVSFGTLFGTVGLEEAAAQAALDSGATVVVVTRNELNIDHQRLHLIPWASMPALLRGCAAVIHHGGWGSTVAALEAAVPAVVIPLGADQELQAVRLASVGAAVAFREGDNPSRERIAAAIESVLDDGGYRVNASRLAAEIEAMPSTAEVVPLVEQLAETGGPVLNR